MKTIHKFPLTMEELTVIEIPKDAAILTVQLQRGKPVLWALVDTAAPKVRRTIRTVCTGENLDDPLNVVSLYLGTYQMTDGDVVLHVFEYMMSIIIP